MKRFSLIIGISLLSFWVLGPILPNRAKAYLFTFGNLQHKASLLASADAVDSLKERDVCSDAEGPALNQCVEREYKQAYEHFLNIRLGAARIPASRGSL